MKRNRIALLIVILLMGSSAPSWALPSNEVVTTYYSTSAKTQVVGARILSCLGGVQTAGKTTSYYTKTSTKCAGGGASKPPAVPCEFRDKSTTCLNVPIKRVLSF